MDKDSIKLIDDFKKEFGEGFIDFYVLCVVSCHIDLFAIGRKVYLPQEVLGLGDIWTSKLSFNQSVSPHIEIKSDFDFSTMIDGMYHSFFREIEFYKREDIKEKNEYSYSEPFLYIKCKVSDLIRLYDEILLELNCYINEYDTIPYRTIVSDMEICSDYRMDCGLYKNILIRSFDKYNNMSNMCFNKGGNIKDFCVYHNFPQEFFPQLSPSYIKVHDDNIYKIVFANLLKEDGVDRNFRIVNGSVSFLYNSKMEYNRLKDIILQTLLIVNNESNCVKVPAIFNYFDDLGMTEILESIISYYYYNEKELNYIIIQPFFNNQCSINAHAYTRILEKDIEKMNKVINKTKEYISNFFDKKIKIIIECVFDNMKIKDFVDFAYMCDIDGVYYNCYNSVVDIQTILMSSHHLQLDCFIESNKSQSYISRLVDYIPIGKEEEKTYFFETFVGCESFTMKWNK